MPLGVLTSLEGRWQSQDFCLLSVYRPPEGNDKVSLRSLVDDELGTDMEEVLWSKIDARMSLGPAWLCGDFNLSPTKLDDKLHSVGHYYRRVPFTGEHLSFRRWDSINQHLQSSSIDHLVWNGQGRPTCSLADDGWFVLDHIPVVTNTGISAVNPHTKPTELKRNSTLNCNDKGACRRFINGMNSYVNKLGEDVSSISLEDITAESTRIVNSINLRRNNKKSPNIWSPIAHLLNLRLSALGSTVRMRMKGDNTSLRPIISQLRYDESKITLNEDETDWLEANDIDVDPPDWDDWKTKYTTTSNAARELLRFRKLLSQENRKEFRRMHSERMGRLQEEADAGRIGSLLKDITGWKQAFNMESIRIDDVVVTDCQVVC